MLLAGYIQLIQDYIFPTQTIANFVLIKVDTAKLKSSRLVNKLKQQQDNN